MGSFGLLFLAAALRWGMRPYAKDNSSVNAVFQLLGGEVTGRGPAYVALGGIGLAFVCSLTGFIWFLSEVGTIHHLKHEIAEHEKGHDGAHDHGHEHKEKAEKKDA